MEHVLAVQAEVGTVTANVSAAGGLAAVRDLVERAAVVWEVRPELITSGHKDQRVVEARSVVCCVAAERLGLTLAAVGRALTVSSVSVWRGVQSGRRLLGQHPELAQSLLSQSTEPCLRERPHPMAAPWSAVAGRIEKSQARPPGSPRLGGGSVQQGLSAIRPQRCGHGSVLHRWPDGGKIL
ncbi:MAG: hypothetical protein A3J75_05560 [Acidobacteria bacterium RBG_16_68_9]|nr:MAG: hypothetical protein A3J75_05560 [Acidobacteria bacterium RBG_16_68_9]